MVLLPHAFLADSVTRFGVYKRAQLLAITFSSVSPPLKPGRIYSPATTMNSLQVFLLLVALVSVSMAQYYGRGWGVGNWGGRGIWGAGWGEGWGGWAGFRLWFGNDDWFDWE